MKKNMSPATRVCPVCDVSFEVGGRGRPRRKQIYCSRRCTALARVRQPRTNRLSDVDAAYLAGLLDGEGSIVAARKRERRTTWRLQICNTDFELLEWCRKTMGVGTIVHSRRSNPRHSPAGWWQCYSVNAKDILEQLLPYLKLGEKIRRAHLVIDELNSLRR